MELPVHRCRRNFPNTWQLKSTDIDGARFPRATQVGALAQGFSRKAVKLRLGATASPGLAGTEDRLLSPLQGHYQQASSSPCDCFCGLFRTEVAGCRVETVELKVNERASFLRKPGSTPPSRSHTLLTSQINPSLRRKESLGMHIPRGLGIYLSSVSLNKIFSSQRRLKQKNIF